MPFCLNKRFRENSGNLSMPCAEGALFTWFRFVAFEQFDCVREELFSSLWMDVHLYKLVVERDVAVVEDLVGIEEEEVGCLGYFVLVLFE